MPLQNIPQEATKLKKLSRPTVGYMEIKEFKDLAIILDISVIIAYIL
jgi:hypothetical protein